MLSLPIIVTQICKEWMLYEEFNLVMHEKVKNVTETISSSYQVSIQIYWTSAMSQEHIVIASSLSSESKDEDEEFFEQEPPEENRAFMKLIWEGIKKTYKMIKEKKKKKDEPRIWRTCLKILLEGGGE